MDNTDSSSNSSNESYHTALEDLETYVEFQSFVQHRTKDGTVWILPCEYDKSQNYVHFKSNIVPQIVDHVRKLKAE